VLNLINFLRFKESKSKPDAIATENFKLFRELITESQFRAFFPTTPFGGDGLESPLVIALLTLALSRFRLRGKVQLEDDLSVDSYDKGKWDTWFRYGTEKPFITPANVDDALGLACIKEDKRDDLCHWVVFVGKGHLEECGIACKSDWNGIVLDSDRGYAGWQIGVESKLPCVKIARSEDTEPNSVDWICSFISIFL
jgi:hypothetical protein